jgi:TRAP-type C4-dicarboxylate transport system permease small subunit
MILILHATNYIKGHEKERTTMSTYEKIEPEEPPGKSGIKVQNADSRIGTGLLKVNRFLVYIAGIGLFVMMMVTVCDVAGRYVFNRPITGAYELVGFMLALAGPLAMGYSQIKKGHIRVDFLFRRFSRRVQWILTSTAYLIGTAVFSLITWRLVILVQYYLSLKRGSATDTLGMPYFPFVIITAIGCGILALVLIYDLVHSIAEVKRK